MISGSDKDTLIRLKQTHFFFFFKVKSIGPKLVPFLKAVCVYFVAWLPESEKPTVFAAILKILPILCLCGFVGLQGISLEKEHNYSRHILLGLIFSGIGDVCLVWKNMYFIHGMIAFGIAHILYIRAFGFQPFQPRNLPLLLFCFFPGLFVYTTFVTLDYKANWWSLCWYMALLLLACCGGQLPVSKIK